MDFVGDLNELFTNLFNTSARNNSFYWIPEDIANASLWEAFRELDILNEPWLIFVIAFHVISLVIATLYRKNSSYIFLHLVTLLCLCYASELLNGFLAKHYKTFTKYQYFDSNGVFLICIWSAPLIVEAFLCLVYLLVDASNLLVAVKRHELNRKTK